MGEEKKSDYEDAYAPRERAAKNEPLSASASSMYTSSIVLKYWHTGLYFLPLCNKSTGHPNLT